MTDRARLWIGTSWKMNKTLAEARRFAEALIADAPAADPRVQRFVVPPFTAIREVKALLAETAVLVGAQTMHWADSGPWTGEISPPMLRDCGVDLVELGHSERRAHFGETDETVGRKVAAAVRHGLTPLICIGETATQRDAGRADAVLADQVAAALDRLDDAGRRSPILFAYEPVWAIGDGGTSASADYAEARHARIKAVAAERLAGPPPCLYGGSVTPGNGPALIARRHVDGLFIGRSAWQAEGYLDILKRCEAALDTIPGEVT